MRKIQQGFTLIELMIVVAIVGILAAIAIPSYQDYTVRSKITEGINAVDAAKTSVSEFYTSQGHMPNSAASAGITSPSTNIIQGLTYAQASTNNATLSLAFKAVGGSMTAGQTLVYAGYGSSTGVTWTCTNGASGQIQSKYKPANCR